MVYFTDVRQILSILTLEKFSKPVMFLTGTSSITVEVLQLYLI